MKEVGSMRYHEVIQANFHSAKRYWAVISAPKSKNSEIYVVTLILKKTVFIPSQVFPGKISSGMGHFSTYRNQRFSSPPTMWGASSLGNFCVPEPGHYLVPPVLKSCIMHSETMKMNEAALDIYNEENIHQFQPGNTHKIQQQLQKHRV